MRYAFRVLPFPTTHRSVLERVRSDNADLRRLAFGDLAEGYWRPSYHYLRLHWHLPAQTAEDLVQAFFAVAFEKHYLEKYDPTKARFRTFLRTCLDRFVQNQQKAERAGKRGGGAAHLPLDFSGAERELAAIASNDRHDSDRFFRDETIRALFGHVVDAMRAAYAAERRDVIYRVFARHDLQPSAETTYATVAAELGLTVAQVTNHLHAARRRFRELALDRLRAISATDAEFRDEARDLFGVDVA